MVEGLQAQFPSLGWKQFLINRQKMLDDYDQARTKSNAHRVKAYHGNVAESTFREWLSNFLPKRYGVTAGYILSPGFKSIDPMPHYDVIVFDQLESPVLWIEEYPDKAPQGYSRAIPAEYVHCVLEVKSNFTSTTVDEAIKHLSKLTPLLNNIDKPDEAIKLHLPQYFCCGLVFFNLLKKDEYSETALKKMTSGASLRGFFGGVILRGEGHNREVTGRLTLLESKKPIERKFLSDKQCLLDSGMVFAEKNDNYAYLGAMLIWLEPFFARFAFDIISMIQGKYKVGMYSSCYCLGSDGFEYLNKK